jgi:hypothetical protein
MTTSKARLEQRENQESLNNDKQMKRKTKKMPQL